MSLYRAEQVDPLVSIQQSPSSTCDSFGALLIGRGYVNIDSTWQLTR